MKNHKWKQSLAGEDTIDELRDANDDEIVDAAIERATVADPFEAVQSDVAYYKLLYRAAVDDLHDQLRQNAVEMWRTLNETERVRWLVENIDGHLLLADEDIDEAIENAKLFA